MGYKQQREFLKITKEIKEMFANYGRNIINHKDKCDDMILESIT